MLKLIIADDERIIRETIAQLIDWHALGIEVIGLCKNGLEAYNMIIDEYPDIVLTDIKMPGLSGLELIRQVGDLDLNIEFVILSGYSDFNFAKEAMQYGVQHYLLKPCNETQIQEVIKKVICKCYDKQSFQKVKFQQHMLTKQFEAHVINNLIMESLHTDTPLAQLIVPYSHQLDFHHTTYHHFYLFYLEERFLDSCLQKIHQYNQNYLKDTQLFFIYVKNTLSIFFTGQMEQVHALQNYLASFSFSGEAVTITTSYQAFSSLINLLAHLLEKVGRYSVIYLIDNLHKIPTSNYASILNAYRKQATQPTLSSSIALLKDLEDLDLIKSLTGNILLNTFFDQSSTYTPLQLLQLLSTINSCADTESIFDILDEQLDNFSVVATEDTTYTAFIKKTLQYINAHFANPDLTLKWIAENYLYMNVDYVSKQFLKQTGVKFSTYLTNLRMEKAKILLLEKGSDKIYEVAEQTGFGNNPQYFSQLFKKTTGMTPSTYANSKLG